MSCRVVFAWRGSPPVRGACCPDCAGDLQQFRVPMVMPEVEAAPLGAVMAEAVRRYWRTGEKPDPIGLFDEVLRYRERMVREVALAKGIAWKARGSAAGEP